LKDEKKINKTKISSKTSSMIKFLREQNIKTWFDLCLFLDKLHSTFPKAKFSGSNKDFSAHIESSGIAIISFYFSVDGVTIEANKYYNVFKTIFPNVKIHYIAGRFSSNSQKIISSEYQKEIKQMDGFDNWPLFEAFFRKKFSRGSKIYNQLILDFWEESLLIARQLGSYIEKENISLLYNINVCSNPGNLSTSLAIVLVSEYFGIPVINNNHDFYWEGGSKDIDKEKGLFKKGPRDLFFTNSHIGEFFSVIEVLFPWQRKSWLNVNINSLQKQRVVNVNGHNPSNVADIGTAIDYKSLQNTSRRAIIESFYQIASIFRGDKQTVEVNSVRNITRGQSFLKPILLGDKKIVDFNFANNNIIFLQPTRVVNRKSIELNFKMVLALVSETKFKQKFVDNPTLKLSLIVTGPIASGQREYYYQLLSDFSSFLQKLPSEFKSKIFLGFLFSEFDKNAFRKKYRVPINIWKLYQIASLILLPSKTEGRGLPILEAAVSGTPIFCKQYSPKIVYEEVIGKNLNEKNRLRVLEFSGSRISKTLIHKIIDQVFYPQNSIKDLTHNLNVIKHRYSYDSLEKDMNNILKKLFLQLNSIHTKEDTKKIQTMFDKYNKSFSYKNTNLELILNQKTRHYLPGYSRLAFMIYLKSLIDPSFFRVEKQILRGRVFRYAKRVLKTVDKDQKKAPEKTTKFFNLVEAIFEYQNGEYSIRHDHSFAYRNRNRLHFAYMDYTYQEIVGLVNMIFHSIFPVIPKHSSISPQFFSDWKLALFQLTGSDYLGIDDRDILVKKLKENVPKGYFPGKYMKYEMEYFILQPFRTQLNLSIDKKLTENLLLSKKNTLETTFIFVRTPEKDIWASYLDTIKYINSNQEPELTLLYKHKLVKIIQTQQWCNGVHFLQMGKPALAILSQIKKKGGFFITNGEHAAMMTDTIEIDHFHIGKARRVLTAKIMGVPLNSGFIQFVPAGVRTTLTYPVPIQTSRDFSNLLKSKLFHSLSDKLGREKLLKIIGEDAIQNGTPLIKLLKKLDQEDEKYLSKPVKTEFIGGVYEDGHPWSGVMAKIDMKQFKWNFCTYSAKEAPKNVIELTKEYKKEKDSSSKILIAWNGGYILNPELVGKLGLSEKYIGSPLGLLIVDNKLKCPPLFSKPALIIYKNGQIDIQPVSSKNGFRVGNAKNSMVFDSSGYNNHQKNAPCFYDLNYSKNPIPKSSNIIVRLAGVVVKEIIYPTSTQKVDIIPVGLTLSIPQRLFLGDLFKVGKSIHLSMLSSSNDKVRWPEVSSAVEAGPLLVRNNEAAIDMSLEGWTTTNSIKTQAARLDFTDMRGPKIALGIGKLGNLMILAINGRIRESVGATHTDMADILLKQGAQKGMGFDPGGSSTLFVDGQIVNISPYNSQYEYDNYALDPTPRFVSNIVLGWLEKK